MRGFLKGALASLAAILVAAGVVFAAASYPAAVKSFTQRQTGEVIQATWFNEPYDEITAIEQALLTTGFEHALKPKTTGTYDLGTTTLGWQQLFLDLGTITADTQAIDIKGTWNAAAVAFTALKLNITDTASAAASLLLDLQVGGVSKFKVDKSGTGTFAGGINPGADGVQDLGTGSLRWKDLYLAGFLRLGTTGQLRWTNGANFDILYQSAAGAVALDIASVLKYKWDATAFQPGADNVQDLGTGSLRWKDLFLGGTATLGRDPAVALEAATKQYVDALGSGADSPFRIIRGRIDTTGPTILQGAGFTVSKPGTGRVTVTFSTAFGGAPTVVAIADRSVGTNGRIVFLNNAPTTTQAEFGRVTISDVFDDGTLGFIAVGPR